MSRINEQRSAALARPCRFWTAFFAAAMVYGLPLTTRGQAPQSVSYQALTRLFEQWRAFERPPLREGAPDYTAATLSRKHAELRTWQRCLSAIDTTGWSAEQQIDWHLVRAEMNGLDFYIRVLKPWARDPAYYATVWPDQSDTPDHERPTNHGSIELWTYSSPLSPNDRERLAGELRTIPPLLRQARLNLTGNARDLWMAGIGSVKNQVRDLDDLGRTVAGAGPALTSAVRDARQ